MKNLISVKQSAIATLIAIGAVSVGVTAVQAESISFSTDAISGTGFNSQNGTLPYFNGLLGKLNHVTVELTGRYQLFTGIENEDEQAGYVYANAAFYTYSYLFLGGHDFNLTESKTADSGTVAVKAFDGLTDYAGDSGRSVKIDHQLQASRLFDTNSPALTAFIGNGTFNTFLSSAMYGYGWAYGSNFTIRRSAKVTDLAIKTTYDYTAAPEPVLVPSLLGLGAMLLRKRRNGIASN
jgi:hypothetical protein